MIRIIIRIPEPASRVFSPMNDESDFRVAQRKGKRAVVTGGHSGVGLATVKALEAEGVEVTVVSRRDGLDAKDPAVAERVLREIRPDYLVLNAGIPPRMAPLDDPTLSFESFSAVWNNDVQATFHFLQAALRLPLTPGSSVVIVSSGAAIEGSPLSGGYAGAKRMQWLLAGYAQKVANAKNLNVRFTAVLPKQLIEGTQIGQAAADAYGAAQGMSAHALFARFEAPLTPEKVARSIVAALAGETPSAIAVMGARTEPLA